MSQPVGQIRAAVDDFADYAALVLGRSPNTVKGYVSDLGTLTGYADTFDAFTLPTLRAWLADALRAGRSRATLARRTAAARAFSTWAYRQGYIEQDAAARLKAPKVNRPLPNVVRGERAAELVEADTADDAHPAEHLRDRAILELLYATGIRVSELTGLDVDDVVGLAQTGDDGGQPVVRLFGKGSKERVVPIGSYAAAALDAWLVRGRPTIMTGVTRSTPALFVNARGGRLSRQSAWAVLKRAAERAGLEADVSPHTLRHCFATHLLAGGADVRVVQELLGHASVTTTQVYTLVTVDSLREVYSAAHPRAR